VDRTPPNTTIRSGPTARTRSGVATFRLASNEAGSRFQCKLDRGAWGACGATKTYRGVKRGAHTFQARAIDRAGNVDRSPARRTWRRT
jgi:hypothetical protein